MKNERKGKKFRKFYKKIKKIIHVSAGHGKMTSLAGRTILANIELAIVK